MSRVCGLRISAPFLGSSHGRHGRIGFARSNLSPLSETQGLVEGPSHIWNVSGLLKQRILDNYFKHGTRDLKHPWICQIVPRPWFCAFIRGSFIGVVTFKGQISMRSSHFYEWVVSNQGNCMCLLGQKWRVCVCLCWLCRLICYTVLPCWLMKADLYCIQLLQVLFNYHSVSNPA